VTFSIGLETSRNCLSGRMMISLNAMAGFKLGICGGQCVGMSALTGA
jgi:hypothetical protein